VIQTRGKRQIEGSNNKGFEGLFLVCGHETPAENAIDGSLEGIPGTADLLFEESGDIVVDGKGGSHIMMLAPEAS
jgi:hypothetical protein